MWLLQTHTFTTTSNIKRLFNFVQFSIQEKQKQFLYILKKDLWQGRVTLPVWCIGEIRAGGIFLNVPKPSIMSCCYNKWSTFWPFSWCNRGPTGVPTQSSAFCSANSVVCWCEGYISGEYNCSLCRWYSFVFVLSLIINCGYSNTL